MRRYKMNKIKIYTLSACPYCKATKKFLRKHNIGFENIEIDENKQAREEMYRKSKQYGVPVIEIKKNRSVGLLIGFDEGKLKQMLNIK